MADKHTELDNSDLEINTTDTCSFTHTCYDDKYPHFGEWIHSVPVQPKQSFMGRFKTKVKSSYAAKLVHRASDAFLVNVITPIANELSTLTTSLSEEIDKDVKHEELNIFCNNSIIEDFLTQTSGEG